MRVLIIYNNVEVLKDFTELLSQKSNTLKCISISGATLVNALEYHPDVIIVEACEDDRCIQFMKRLIARKLLFKASIFVYNRDNIQCPELPGGIKLIHTLKDLEKVI